MKYLPHLIPEQSRVLPDYFKPLPHIASNSSRIKKTLQWALGLFFFLPGIMSLIHPLLAMLWIMCGFIAIPPGHRFLEKRLRFRLTTAIKTVALLTLFISSLPLLHHYAAMEAQTALHQRLADDRAAKEKAVADKQEQHRKDTFTFYLNEGRKLGQERQWDASSKQLQRAMTYARSHEERSALLDIEAGQCSNRSQALIQAGKYKEALLLIDTLIASGAGSMQTQYNRALCYSKTGRIAAAVSDLKALMKAGNTDAEKLHNKINPLRKRIVGYETLCCDGSTSGARGRGACSHHGGVCDWNHPIYEEYRKYE